MFVTFMLTLLEKKTFKVLFTCRLKHVTSWKKLTKKMFFQHDFIAVVGGKLYKAGVEEQF